jgi:hypothetical protein
VIQGSRFQGPGSREGEGGSRIQKREDKENLLIYRDLNPIELILLVRINLFQTILKRINSNIR